MRIPEKGDQQADERHRHARILCLTVCDLFWDKSVHRFNSYIIHCRVPLYVAAGFSNILVPLHDCRIAENIRIPGVRAGKALII